MCTIRLRDCGCAYPLADSQTQMPASCFLQYYCGGQQPSAHWAATRMYLLLLAVLSVSHGRGVTKRAPVSWDAAGPSAETLVRLGLHVNTSCAETCQRGSYKERPLVVRRRLPQSKDPRTSCVQVTRELWTRRRYPDGAVTF